MNPKIHYPVGHRIRNLRKQQRITQEELATWLQAVHAPITRSIVVNWESGRGEHHEEGADMASALSPVWRLVRLPADLSTA